MSSGDTVAYRVVLADAAKADVHLIYDWVLERAPIRGPEWFDDLMDCLYSLEQLPYRCPLAREAAEMKRDVRCLHFGRRRHTYRILYEIDEAARTVTILHIRHGALKDFATSEVDEPLPDDD